MPSDYDLPPNFVVQLTAVDPTTGATVSGVTVSNIAIMADPITPGTADEISTLVPVAPLWLPEPVSAPASGG